MKLTRSARREVADSGARGRPVFSSWTARSVSATHGLALVGALVIMLRVAERNCEPVLHRIAWDQEAGDTAGSDSAIVGATRSDGAMTRKSKQHALSAISAPFLLVKESGNRGELYYANSWLRKNPNVTKIPGQPAKRLEDLSVAVYRREYDPPTWRPYHDAGLRYAVYVLEWGYSDVPYAASPPTTDHPWDYEPFIVVMEPSTERIRMIAFDKGHYRMGKRYFDPPVDRVHLGVRTGYHAYYFLTESDFQDRLSLESYRVLSPYRIPRTDPQAEHQVVYRWDGASGVSAIVRPKPITKDRISEWNKRLRKLGLSLQHTFEEPWLVIDSQRFF